MISALYIQFKIVLRDKIVIISILLPVFLAIFLTVDLPDTMTIENQIAVIKNDLSDEIIDKIKQIATVTEFSSLNEMKERVLVPKDEIVGIVLDDTRKATTSRYSRSEYFFRQESFLNAYESAPFSYAKIRELSYRSTREYKYILEGNETTRTLKDLEVIDNFLKGNNPVNKINIEFIPNTDNDMKYFLMILTMIIALYMGSTLIAFNIIEEKESGINNINKILPISTKQFIFYKILIGLLGTIFITSVTGFILVGKSYFQYLFLFSFIAACCSSSLGLYLGLFSKDIISGIIYTKVILLLFIFVPVIGFIMPNNVINKLFYLIPTYPIFEGFWCIIRFGDEIGMLKNMAIILVHTVIAYTLYYYISRSSK